jgi:hypothetical protein
VDWISLAQDSHVEGSWACGTEHSGSIKRCEVPEWLHNWWPLVKVKVTLRLMVGR